MSTGLVHALSSEVAQATYCPCCLRRVGAKEAARRAHRETCRSGALDCNLLVCPTCGLVLAAMPVTSPAWRKPPTARV